MNMKEQITKWKEHVADTCFITTDLTLLTKGTGYISGEVVHYNASPINFIINKDKFSRSGGAIKVLQKLARDLHIEDKSRKLNRSDTGFNNPRLLLTKTELTKEGVCFSVRSDEAVTKLLDIEARALDGEFPIEPNKGIGNAGSGWFDFEKSFEGIDETDVLEWIVLASRPEFPTLHNSRKQDREDENGHIIRTTLGCDTVEAILDHPVGKLLQQLKVLPHLQGIYANAVPCLKTEIEAYIRMFDVGSTITRTPLSTFLTEIKAMASCLVFKLSALGYLYLPFLCKFEVNIEVGKGTWNSSNSLADRLFDFYAPMTNKQSGIAKRINLRGILQSSNIERIEDFPIHFVEDISAAQRVFQEKHGKAKFGTIRKADWIAFFNAIETTEWTSKHPRFDRTYLSSVTNRKLKTHNQLRGTGRYTQLESHAGEEIIEFLRAYAKNASKSSIHSLNYFADWIVSESSNIYFDCIADIKHFHTYSNGEVNHGLNNTLYEYIAGLNEQNTTNRSHWRVIKRFLTKSAQTVSINTGNDLTHPIIEETPFGSDDKRQITTREAMPSLLHELCLEVLLEDDYKIYTDQVNSKGLFNQKTHTREWDTYNRTVPRCLHLLMLLPIRGMQARWLDEGLLDDQIWDFEKAQYVKNTHPLANYKYDDGVEHVNKFGRTGVIRNPSGSGKENLDIFVNTNKTQSRKDLIMGAKPGYEIPWPADTDVDSLNQVYEIINEQKKFNEIYSPPVTTPVNQLDEDNQVYEGIKNQLPYYVPLFRRVQETISKSFPDTRRSLLLPITADALRKLFVNVLREAERRYKEKYPQFKDSLIAFDCNGQPRFDIHSLRVYGVTDLLDNDVPLEVVQMIVGHATSVMTMYYRKKNREEFLELLREAKKTGGASLLHEKSMIEKLGLTEENKQEIIALFDIVDDWKGGTQKVNARPDFDKGGRDKFINGGVCSSFDCKTGGIDVTYTKGGKKVTVTSVEGGDYRCGNCRYFRTGPRYLAEQILYFNLIALEIRELVEKRKELMRKANEIFDHPELELSSIKADRYLNQADQVTKVLAHRIVESRRRKALIDRSRQPMLGESGTNKDNIENSLAVLGQPQSEINFTSEQLSMFDACMETSTQAAVLGIEDIEADISLRKLEKFISQTASLAKEQNPLYFIPDDNDKRLAILFKLHDASELMGRSITDEEFKNPHLLMENLGRDGFKALAQNLTNYEVSLLQEAS